MLLRSLPHDPLHELVDRRGVVDESLGLPYELHAVVEVPVLCRLDGVRRGPELGKHVHLRKLRQQAGDDLPQREAEVPRSLPRRNGGRVAKKRLQRRASCEGAPPFRPRTLREFQATPRGFAGQCITLSALGVLRTLAGMPSKFLP
eukprot:scaffold24_cov245-Pinguiococcus_pyrenoidosus.AAC.21